MAKVPMNFNTGATGPSLLGGPKPSSENLLMAAADMHSEGVLKSPTPNERPKLPSRQVRKLKLVK